jgi:cation diffusion facilitator CzcD-associated flavoprotein CzcO
VRTNVLVIGAGPLGLSISAHLRALGVDHCTVGRPMDTWRSHMPAGLKLKSEPYASEIAAPRAGYDAAAYCRSRSQKYVDRQVPSAFRGARRARSGSRAELTADDDVSESPREAAEKPT